MAGRRQRPGIDVLEKAGASFRPCERAEQVQGHFHGRQGRLGVHAPFEAVAGVGLQAQGARPAADDHRVEAGALDEDVAGAGADARFQAAHDPGQGQGPGGVGDEQVVLVQGDVALVEQAQRLALAGAAHAHLGALQPLQVEDMQRLAAGHHHQVGDVDDVVDRAQAQGEQQLLHVGRRLPHRQVADDAAAVAPAVGRVLDVDGEARRLRAVQVHRRRDPWA